MDPDDVVRARDIQLLRLEIAESEKALAKADEDLAKAAKRRDRHVAYLAVLKDRLRQLESK